MERAYANSPSTAPAPQPAISSACETMASLGSIEARLESLHEKLLGSRLKAVGDATDAPPPSGDIRLLRAFAEQHGQRVQRLDRLIDDLFNGLS
ncbi:MAG: hypothetical protein ACXWLZ_00105 [Rhizomicrobium sp.]